MLESPRDSSSADRRGPPGAQVTRTYRQFACVRSRRPTAVARSRLGQRGGELLSAHSKSNYINELEIRSGSAITRRDRRRRPGRRGDRGPRVRGPDRTVTVTRDRTRTSGRRPKRMESLYTVESTRDSVLGLSRRRCCHMVMLYGLVPHKCPMLTYTRRHVDTYIDCGGSSRGMHVHASFAPAA